MTTQRMEVKVTAAQDLAIERLLAQHARPQWRRVCTCGAVYDRRQWAALPAPRGGDYQPDRDGEQVGLQLRNCVACGSTLACPVLASGEVLP